MTQAQMEDRETNRRISKEIQLDIEKRKVMNKPILYMTKTLAKYMPFTTMENGGNGKS